MDTLVVQMGVKHGRVAELTRSHDGKLSVGRSYENDLVLTDRHVAAHQVEFFEGESSWKMRVLDRTNPVLLNSKPVEEETVEIASGDKVTLGRTRLSLFSTSDSVEPASKLVLSNWLARDSSSMWQSLLFLFAVIVFDFLLTYLEGSIDLKWQGDARDGLFVAICIVLWAGLWALAGRVFRQQHHMGLQLLATTAVYLLAVCFGVLAVLIAGTVYSVPFNEYVGYGMFLVLLVILFRLNLLIATNLQRTFLTALILAVLVVATPYAFYKLADTEEFEYTPAYSHDLVPPFVQFGAGVTADEYFSASRAEAEALEPAQ